MKRIGIVLASIFLLASPALVFAQSSQYTNGGSNQPVAGGSNTVQNPLGNINSFCGLIKALLTAIIAIGIPVAVLFIVFAGFKFVIAMGNPSKLGEARRNLGYTLAGIGIFLGAWLLAMVIANTVNALGAGSSQSQIISCN
jgi:hypothetical protein